MKKLLFLFVTLLLTFGCVNTFDDTEINNRLDDLEDRVSKLEELCNQMNTNISSLQTIVAALQNNDYITSVTPITENGEEIGYTITFAKSNPITIYHGQDGKDGANGTDGKDGIDGEDGADGKDGVDGKDGYYPVIGVRQDTDGIYYWTLDGEWLLDDEGNKIKAVGTDGKDGQNGQDGADGSDGADGNNGKDGVDGTDGTDGKDGVDGKDGITPQLKIEEGYWYISYDNGATWTMLGKATGENGQDGIDGADGENGIDGKDGDSMFKEIKQDENNVYFVLVDGTEIVVPKQKELSISFSDSDIGILAGKSTTVDYVITGATDKTVVKAFGQGGWYAKVTPATNSTGTITVTAPDPLTEDEIIVLVNDGEYRSIMTSISFVTGVFSSAISAQEVAIEGGNISIDVETNMKYEVVIPDNAKSWLSVVGTKALRTETITLNCAKNEGLQRTATIKILDEYGNEFSNYAIFQYGISASVTDLSNSGTANCYIVSSNVGYYKFKITKGNSAESVGLVASAEVLWETFGTNVAPNVGDLISDISYSNDYITFRTGTTYKEGNALIAAKDENGTILWSWHIWFTDMPKDQVYNNNAGTMMDRNLGATSATPGDVGALGLLYQWGRKDPFLSGESMSSDTQAASTITWSTPVSSDESNGTIAYATANPTTFIIGNSRNRDWFYSGDGNTDNTRWQSAKTIYDPCPVGYRVPDGGDNGVWYVAFGGALGTLWDDMYPEWDNTNYGYDFGGTEVDKNYLTTEECWYPCAGSMGDYAGRVYSNGGGNYWSCTHSGDAISLRFSNVSVDPSNATYNHGEGMSVRCLKE